MKFSPLFRSAAVIGALIVGSIVAPQVVAAQALVDGPRITSVGVSNVVETIHLTSAPLAPAQDNLTGNGQNVAMMVVGGAAIVVGGLVGGDGGTIIAVTGAVIGLMGLFRHLR